MPVQRFDFLGTAHQFETTPQGFVRLDARLTRTGIFTYLQDGQTVRELRLPEEVFREDALKSIAGAPVTDLHPDNFVSPENAKDLSIGFAGEDVQIDGDFVSTKLTITDAQAIAGLKDGSRKEISLGYTCEVDSTPGEYEGQHYDAIQRNIVVNHIALGPSGWGRAGPEVSVKLDEKEKEKSLVEEELQNKLDALEKELAKAKASVRATLIQRCQKILGQVRADSQSDRELKIAAIHKVLPSLDLTEVEDSYLDGQLDAIEALHLQRNDSLAAAHQATQEPVISKPKPQLWTQPLSGHL